MAIYEITADEIRTIPKTTYSLAGLRERYDLQRLLRSQFDVISPDTLIIAEEFGDWDTGHRRIDLLGIDKNANLVIVELKRTEDGGFMELQAIRCAAMVSAMTFEQGVEVYANLLSKEGSNAEDAQATILSFLEWEEPDEDRLTQDVRIILVVADFSKELRKRSASPSTGRGWKTSVPVASRKRRQRAAIVTPRTSGRRSSGGWSAP